MLDSQWYKIAKLHQLLFAPADIETVTGQSGTIPGRVIEPSRKACIDSPDDLLEVTDENI